MERSEKIGLGVALIGHAVLFGLLSLRFLTPPVPMPETQAIDVTLAKDVALVSQAPQVTEEPAPSIAPDQGEPDEAAPPPPETAPPEPEPKPQPTPPKPQPAPPKPAPPKPAPKPAPAPAPKPEPKPAPKLKPEPKPRPAPEKPAPEKPAPAKPSKADTTSKKAPPAEKKGTGSSASSKISRPHGSLLGPDFLKGIADAPSKSTSPAPKAAAIGAQQLASIGAAIQRQIQPCANRQVTPGPGAERIRVTINLRLNHDGSLAARPTVKGHDGVDAGNRRYVDRVDDLAIAAFVGCSPLHGLPDELYDVPGGWSNFTLRYKLPG